MGSTGTKEQTQNVLEQVHKVQSTDEAQAKIAIFPAVMAYEARYALQQLKETTSDPQQLVEIIEPLARAVGWAEGLAYVFDRQSVGSTGMQTPAGNGGRSRS